MIQKIKFSNLSIWLKVGIILSWGMGGLFALSFVIDFFKILFGVY